MRKFSGVLVGLWAIVMVAGCNPKLTIQMRPHNVLMDYVNIDGKPAQPVKGVDGQFDGKISFGEASSIVVPVIARSAQGVEVNKSFKVEKNQSDPRDLNMPAEVHVRTQPSQSGNIAVTIDEDESVVSENGVYKKKIETDKWPRKIKFSATNMDTGLHAKDEVELHAGDLIEKKLNLDLVASFKPNKHIINYGEEIIFDASTSSPTNTVSSYIWTFGDGNTYRGGGSTVKHAYDFNSNTGKVDEYTVTLIVQAGEKQSKPTTQKLSVEVSNKELVFKIEKFPQGRFSQPGETVEFMLFVVDPASDKKIMNLTFLFGDEQMNSGLENGKPINLECEDGFCKQIIISHNYTHVGEFVPSLTYTEVFDPGKVKTATLMMRDESQATVTISPNYVSGDDLIEQAWDDFYKHFAQLLREAKVDKKYLVLTSLDNANFETDEDENEIVTVIDRLTRNLVADSFFVLERKAQVLSRLAPEAVVNVRPELVSGSVGSGVNESDPIYQHTLDYALAMEHHGAIKPIIYSVEIAGTGDRIMQIGQIDQRINGDGSVTSPRDIITERQISEGKSSATQWARNLPILMARFKTADYLIAIKIIQPPQVLTTKPVTFDVDLQKIMVKQSASVKLEVRILERTGRILKAVEITGYHSQLVSESWAHDNE